MSETENAEVEFTVVRRSPRSASDAATSLVLGLVALLVGLSATMAGACIAYWQGAALASLAAPLGLPEPDRVSLYLIVCGSATTMLGAFSIYRAQDM